MLKTIFLNPPSVDGFDGGAGSRYQAKREIKSFWFPTWLAQPAALVPDSKLIDAPPARLGLDAVLRQAGDFELVVMHTSTPSFASDVKVAGALKDANPKLKIGLVGAYGAVSGGASIYDGALIDSGQGDIYGAVSCTSTRGWGVQIAGQTYSPSPTGNSTLGSSHLTALSTTANIAVGMTASGPGIPTGGPVNSVVSATEVALSNTATSTNTGVAFTFSITFAGNTT